LYSAVLSGDLNGDDAAGLTEENAIHLLRLSGPGIWTLGGVTIRGGRADGSTPDDSGAAGKPGPVCSCPDTVLYML
jgi:hypothetical protein